MGKTNTETVYTFATSSEAWAFMRECDDAGRYPGYPSLKAPYTVRVLDARPIDRCAKCNRPAHASETNDNGVCVECLGTTGVG